MIFHFIFFCLLLCEGVDSRIWYLRTINSLTAVAAVAGHAGTHALLTAVRLPVAQAPLAHPCSSHHRSAWFSAGSTPLSGPLATITAGRLPTADQLLAPPSPLDLPPAILTAAALLRRICCSGAFPPPARLRATGFVVVTAAAAFAATDAVIVYESTVVVEKPRVGLRKRREPRRGRRAVGGWVFNY